MHDAIASMEEYNIKLEEKNEIENKQIAEYVAKKKEELEKKSSAKINEINE